MFAVFALCILRAGPLFPQTSLDDPPLKLDLPFQIDAANTFGNFFESYVLPGMSTSLNLTSGVYSAFHYGMKRAGDALGTDAVWKKFIYFGGTALGDYLMYIAPLPLSYIWLHESFHSAVFTRSGVYNYIEWVYQLFHPYTVEDLTVEHDPEHEESIGFPYGRSDRS